jgi:hypothetical protein
MSTACIPLHRSAARLWRDYARQALDAFARLDVTAAAQVGSGKTCRPNSVPLRVFATYHAFDGATCLSTLH